MTLKVAYSSPSGASPSVFSSSSGLLTKSSLGSSFKPSVGEPSLPVPMPDQPIPRPAKASVVSSLSLSSYIEPPNAEVSASLAACSCASASAFSLAILSSSCALRISAIRFFLASILGFITRKHIAIIAHTTITLADTTIAIIIGVLSSGSSFGIVLVSVFPPSLQV